MKRNGLPSDSMQFNPSRSEGSQLRRNRKEAAEKFWALLAHVFDTCRGEFTPRARVALGGWAWASLRALPRASLHPYSVQRLVIVLPLTLFSFWGLVLVGPGRGGIASRSDELEFHEAQVRHQPFAGLKQKWHFTVAVLSSQ